MTNQEIKAQLIDQINQTTRTLHNLEGAIQLIQQLEERDAASEEVAEEPIPVIED